MYLNDSLLAKRAGRLVRFSCLSRTCIIFRVCSSFPFGFEGGFWDLIILIPDRCLSIYFTSNCSTNLFTGRADPSSDGEQY